MRRGGPKSIFVAPPSVPIASRWVPARRPQFSLAFGMPPLALQPPPLRHVPVRGDGRCLFRAIAKNIARSEGRSLSERLERADADYLRNLAWNAICKRRRQEFAKRNIVEGNIASYCAVSKDPSFYGGEPELFALADELKVPIRVYLRAEGGRLRNIVTYGEKYEAKMRVKYGDGAIRLLYVNGNHYDALLPR